VVTGWQAFRIGLARAVHYWQVWILLFGVSLLSALLLASLPALSLASGPGHRPAIRDAADGVDAWLVIETLMSPSTTASLEGWEGAPELTDSLQQALLLGLLTAGGLPFFAWIPTAFLSGGLLLTYAEAPDPFHWRRFLWGCWHWFGAFLLLGAIQGILSGLVLIPTVVALGGAIAAQGSILVWVIVLLLALAAIFWLVLMECTRMVAVVVGTRNIIRATGGAVHFLFRRPLPVAGLYGLTFLLSGLVHLLYRLGLMPYLPLDWWPLVLLVQQTFILARLGTRFLRLAGGVALISWSMPAAQVQQSAGQAILETAGES
jgi:hypothetical protein